VILINLIAPAGLQINSNYIQIGKKICTNYFCFYLSTNLTTGWLSSVITLDQETNVGMFIHPAETNAALKELTKKTAQVQSQMSMQAEKRKSKRSKIRICITKHRRIKNHSSTRIRKTFKLGLYITFFAEEPKQLDEIENKIRALLENQDDLCQASCFPTRTRIYFYNSTRIGQNTRS